MNLKALRLKLVISRAEMARRIGVSLRTLARIESDPDYQPSDLTTAAINRWLEQFEVKNK